MPIARHEIFSRLALVGRMKANGRFDAPNIVAIAFKNEKNNRPKGRKGEICQASLIIKPQAQTGIKFADFGRGVRARYRLSTSTTTRPTASLPIKPCPSPLRLRVL